MFTLSEDEALDFFAESSESDYEIDPDIASLVNDL